jgi:hypothetical protein
MQTNMLMTMLAVAVGAAALIYVAVQPTRLHYYQEIRIKAPKQKIFDFLVDKRQHVEAHPLIISTKMLDDSGSINSDSQHWEVTDQLGTGRLVYRAYSDIDRKGYKVINRVEPMVLGQLKMTVTQEVAETEDENVFLLKDTTEGSCPYVLEYYTRSTGNAAHKVMLQNMRDYLEKNNN